MITSWQARKTALKIQPITVCWGNVLAFFPGKGRGDARGGRSLPLASLKPRWECRGRSEVKITR
jgi:hypothetical protein